MVDYLRAIKRPFSDIGKLIIGIILMAIPLANVAVVGYIIECAKTSMNKKFKLPDWKMSYFWDGVDATNKPIIKFLCPLQNSFARSCKVRGEIYNYIDYRRAKENSCGGGGKGTWIMTSGQSPKEIEKAKQKIVTLYGVDCDYTIEKVDVYDQLKDYRQCRCGISF